MDAPKTLNDDEKYDFRGLRATRKTWKRLLLKIFWPWSITVVVVGAIYALLVAFSTMPVISNATKRMFNTVITGLLITLGLAIVSSLDALIADLRWWILSLRFYTKDEVDMILGADRLHRLIRLGTKSNRCSIYVAVLFWTLLNIAAQAGLAAIGLCYSIDTAENRALLAYGSIAIADVSRVQTTEILSSEAESLLVQQFTANNYGSISLAFDIKPFEAMSQPGDLYHSRDPLAFCGREHCQYIFHDTSASVSDNDNSDPLAVYTSRTIQSSAVCNSWVVTKGGNGSEDTITVAHEPDDFTIPVPIRGGVNQTTFLTDTLLNCGPGCSVITAFEASDLAPWFYACNVTVHPVINATRPEHQISVRLSSLASSAIALQGYAAYAISNSSTLQHQIYPAQSIFGTPCNGDNDVMAFTMARFAIGVVAIAALYNDEVIVEGDMPIQGVALNVTHWGYIHLTFIIMVSLQFLLALVMTLVANRVVMPSGNVTDLVRVLKQMDARDCSQPCMNGRKQNLEKPLQASLWIFRNDPVSSDGVYDLYMEKRILE